MIDKPEDKFIDELFRDSIGNVETEPSDQFWNKAYDSILQSENSIYQKRIIRLRSVSIILGLAVAGLIGYNVYTTKKVTDIEQKVAGLEKKQLITANNESRSVDALATNSLNSNSNSSPAAQSSQSVLVAQQNLNRNTSTAVQPNTVVTTNNQVAVNNNSVAERQSKSNVPAGNHQVGRVSSSAVAFNNNVSTPSERTHDRNVAQGVNSMIYLEERTPINIPPPDNSDSVLLAMDAEDNASVTPIVVRINEQISPLKPKEHPKVSVSAYLGSSLAEPVIKDNNNSDNITPTEIKSREHELYAYAGGVNVGITPTSTSRFTFQLGCEYRNYRFSLSPSAVDANTGELNSGYSYTTSSGNINMPYLPGYTPFGYYDTVATAKGSAVRSYIDIPLSLKFKFLQTHKLGLYVMAGGSMNILVSNYATVHCQNRWGEEDIYLYDIQGAKAVNFSYMVGLGAEYKMHNGFSLFLQPSYSAAITPNTSGTPITTYFNYFDLTAGVTYQFRRF